MKTTAFLYLSKVYLEIKFGKQWHFRKYYCDYCIKYIETKLIKYKGPRHWKVQIREMKSKNLESETLNNGLLFIASQIGC